MCISRTFLMYDIFTSGYHDRMVVGFTTTCAISAYHHWFCEFEPRSWRCVLDTTLCDKVCLWLAPGQWFSSGTPVSSTNKTDCHDITEILLKLALNASKSSSFVLFVTVIMSNGIHEAVKDEYEILTISKEGYGCKWTWETIKHKT